MKKFRCSSCGQTPALMESDDRRVITCDCGKPTVVIDSRPDPHWIPDKWSAGDTVHV